MILSVPMELFSKLSTDRRGKLHLARASTPGVPRSLFSKFILVRLGNSYLGRAWTPVAAPLDLATSPSLTPPHQLCLLRCSAS
jgi:hypothetical protein